MTEPQLRRRERALKRRYFYSGVIACGVTLLVAAIFGTGLVVTDIDPRPFMAALPLFYIPLLLGGVAWLAWASLAPPRGRSG